MFFFNSTNSAKPHQTRSSGLFQGEVMMDLTFETVVAQLDLIPIAVSRLQLGLVRLRDCDASTFESLLSRFRKDSPNGVSQDNG